jgi:hypothetical protein
MRLKILLIVSLAVTGTGLFAQNLDKAKELLKAHKLPEAKAEIDKVMSVEKNQKSGDAWYQKLKIYNAIAADSLINGQYPDARFQAFDALIKYTESDDKDKKYVLLTIEGFKPVNEIYQGFFKVGADDYNGKKYEDALANFKGALAASRFMNSKGWTSLKIDTTSTLYAGISAEKAGQKDTAATYYARLADSGITVINGSGMVEIYKWLVDHYETNKDEANMNKYLALGQKYFPDELWWATTKLDYLREKGNKDSLFAYYEVVTSQYPKNHLFFFNYGLELYQYASDTSSGKRVANADALIETAQKNLLKCLELQPDYPQASLVMGQISYNAGVDIIAQVKAIKTKPADAPAKKAEDAKKRAELRAAADKKFTDAIPYFEKVDQDLGGKGKLKMEEKRNLKDAYDLLITIYEQKKVQDKVDAYTAKYNDVDKAH